MFSWFNKVSPHVEESAHTLVNRPSTEPLKKVAALSEDATHQRLGNELLAQGRLEEAAECFRRVIAANPDHPENHLNLGFVLSEQHLYEDAKEALRKTIQLDPESADAYYLLGTIAQEQGHQEDAITSFSRSLEIKPDFEIVYRDLCHAYFNNGQYVQARNVILKGLSLNPESADFHYYLGNLQLELNDPENAIKSFQKALLIQPDYAVVYSNMGVAFLDLGDIGSAVACYQQAIALDPNDIQSIGCLLYFQSFNAKCSPAQYLLEAQAYGQKALERAEPFTEWQANLTDLPSPRLRVGLVSGDFRSHPVGFFLESILCCLNQDRIELIAYSTQPKEDEVTARIKPRFASWNLISNLSDEAAAQKIFADGIHILVDLAGHTSHNRLPLFSWKPAPVQVSWLGYWATTGVPGIDYLLADPISVPESHRAHFTEMVWYLPDTRLCFTPPASLDRLPVTPLPALRSGHITFGCFQKTAKMTDDVLDVWRNIFRAMPTARLRIQNTQMNFQTAREHLQRQLRRIGIAPEQVTLVEGSSREHYLAAHAEVDIILDTFPFTGGTTTCEALLMGVPTLTLAGDTMLARQGTSLLTCAGLDKWIARNREEYVTLALAHAGDLNRLAQLRAELRPQVLASPLFDAPLFAGRLEEALYGIWRHAHQNMVARNHV